MARRLPLFLLLFALLPGRVGAAEVAVAVASNFSAPLQAIIGVFAEQTGHSVQVSTASSGKLFAQIQHGAPFDIFLSADEEKPTALGESGEALAETRLTYAVGRLALWGSKTAVNPRPLLETAAFQRLAMANPRLAPYGVAARETLQALGLWDAVQDKLVTGENISQTWQFVATGNAELGFVALSQVIRDGRVPPGAWLVPAELHSPIRQDAVLLARAAKNPAARALLAFLRSPEATAIIRGYGYDTTD
ncbi:molybdate ABC transporter substrate-binding protein [Haliea sp. E17]|uniref:molybdate ABC transporter substrate-binding protein n=1 Tax=Haliea sp. E17 TaxID=3401576 RepID=UPI003AAF487E